MKASLRLFNPQQGHQAYAALWQQAKALLVAGHKLRVTLETERRNNDQNALLHALLDEIAESVEWAGKKREPEVWKRLLTASWMRARGESVEVLPALDGHGIDIVWRPTSQLTKAEMTELLEYVSAWAAEHGVTTKELAR